MPSSAPAETLILGSPDAWSAGTPFAYIEDQHRNRCHGRHDTQEKGGQAMKVKRKVKAGDEHTQHNETLVRVQKPAQGLKVKTHVKARTIIPEDSRKRSQ